MTGVLLKITVRKDVILHHCSIWHANPQQKANNSSLTKSYSSTFSITPNFLIAGVRVWHEYWKDIHPKSYLSPSTPTKVVNTYDCT